MQQARKPPVKLPCRRPAGALSLFAATLLLAGQPAGAAGDNFNKILEQARALKKTRQNAQALGLYKKLVRMRPASSDAHAGLGWVLYELGDVEQGIREEQEAIRLDANNADAHHHLGTMFLRLNMLPQAAEQFQISLSLDPEKRCNCGPIEGLIMSYPPGLMTPEEADRILNSPPGKPGGAATPASNATGPADGGGQRPAKTR